MSCYDLTVSVGNVFYHVILVIGVVGNSLVIIVIVKVKDMLNSTNIFLANLAIADIVVLFTWTNTDIQYVILEWFRRILGCDEFYLVSTFIVQTAMNASVLTALTVGFERYFAICQPLRAGYICTKKKAFRICILAWTLAAISAVPMLIDDSVLNIGWHHYNFYINTAIFFIVPPVVLVVLFSMIVRRLYVAAAPGVNIAAIRHRRHVIIMLATVIFCFFLLQMPSRVWYFMMYWWGSEIFGWLGVDKYICVRYFCDMMLYLHSAVNPVLYNLMSQRFRAGFKDICCLCKPQ